MKRLFLALSIAAAAPIGLTGQGVDLSNVQVHGFATQGFLYSTDNNWNSTESSSGSAAWTEAVVNLTAAPEPRLRIGVQARYFLLGEYGNEITLDYAQADYKVNERFGFRVGKVKTPYGLLNEVQDVDPAYLWAILPQSIYPVASRNSQLAHYGAVVYGAIPFGDAFGKLEYRAFGGERVLSPGDGTFTALQANYGFSPTQAISIPVGGGTIRWNAPMQGLVFGITGVANHYAGNVTVGPLAGSFDSSWVPVPIYFARFERAKWMLGGEYNRFAPDFVATFPAYGISHAQVDQRAFYLMASYKPTAKLTTGLYYSSSNNHRAAFTSDRYQKDWALASRYDFNPSLYLKAEQHIMDGTELGYIRVDNTGGLKPNTLLTLIKLGVSF